MTNTLYAAQYHSHLVDLAPAKDHIDGTIKLDSELLEGRLVMKACVSDLDPLQIW